MCERHKALYCIVRWLVVSVVFLDRYSLGIRWDHVNLSDNAICSMTMSFCKGHFNWIFGRFWTTGLTTKLIKWSIFLFSGFSRDHDYIIACWEVTAEFFSLLGRESGGRDCYFLWILLLWDVYLFVFVLFDIPCTI